MKAAGEVYVPGVIVPGICSSLQATEAYYSATFSMSSQHQQQQQPSDVTWRGSQELMKDVGHISVGRVDARNYV